jgi:hypothetical protein
MRGVVVAALIALIAACTPQSGGGGGPAGPSGTSFQFRANKVTVVNHNDTFLYGTSDEPYLHQIWFRVKLDQANSAQVGVIGSRSDNAYSLSDGGSRNLVGAERAAVDFNNVELADWTDLLAGKKLEIVGTWTWAMEKDDVSVSGVADTIAGVMQNVLNQTVAAATLPSDPNQLVSMVLGDFGTAFRLIAGGLFASIPGIPDDAIGSRFYIGLGSKGTLHQIVTDAAATAAFPTVAIPVVTVPPDIGGGTIYSLGTNVTSFNNQVFDQGQGRHDYDFETVVTPGPNAPPYASFTANPTSSAGAPVTVSFDASASNDPDGTIVSYNWDFGDFTTGAGVNTTHTFTTAGSFPVRLTVMDGRGAARSQVVTINVGGAPAIAPTGLQKTGAGCCNTYGDFSWNQIPGAEAYEINLGASFGNGCLVSKSAVIPGPAGSGRVQDALLCLGTTYSATIRAKANGLWGPWSPAVNIKL